MRHILQSLRFLVSVFLAVGGVGCGTSSEEVKSSGANETIEFIHRYEKTFTPSDYDSERGTEKTDVKTQTVRPEQEIPFPRNEESEVVSGFRVQVSFTEDMEAANQVKSELSSILPAYQVYVVYEAPYYKVRIGDFLSRPDANITVRTLIEKGYRDAWIVPDKVRREPGR